jgi:hypothetical protein
VRVLDRQLSYILARSPFCRSRSGDFRLTARPSCRKHPLFRGVVGRRGLLLKSVQDTYLSSTRTVLLNHTSKARARARSFIVSSRSVSILSDRGRVTPRFRLKERPCLAIFQTFPIIEFICQNFPDHRIRILQALVACSECQLYYTLWVPTRTRPRFGG